MKQTLFLLSLAAMSSFVVSGELSQAYFKEILVCQENGDNSSEAAVTSNCGVVEGYQVELLQVSPDLQVISLIKNDVKKMSWLHTVTKENPFVLHFPIHWLVEDKEPRYLLTKLGIGSEEAPFDYQPSFVVSRVDQDNICPVMTLTTLDEVEAKQYVIDHAKTTLSQRACIASNL